MMMTDGLICSCWFVIIAFASLGFVSGLTHPEAGNSRRASQPSSCGSHKTRAQQGDDGECASQGARETFQLPVFPLRKSVRVPSEALTLNLYEPRYLELAEYVLQQEPAMFGALYSSKKPQLIQKGDGPIVPMVEPGDIGVVCHVLYHEDAFVPISRSGDDGLRRRIKLKALAVGRFRIEKVLHNGYGGGWTCEQDESVVPLSFILVEASRVDDVPVLPGTEEEHRVVKLEKEVFDSIMEKDGMQKQLVADLLGNLPLDPDDDDLGCRTFDAFLPLHLKRRTKLSEETTPIENAFSSWAMGTSSISEEDQQRQIFSFAVSSIAAPEKPLDDALLLLSGTSTLQRLQYAYNALRQSRSWFSISRSLF